MAASVDKLQPPSGCRVEETKTLIASLNLLSRNLPLPPDVLRAVSSIYHADSSVPPSREAQLEKESAPAPEDEVDNADGGTPSSGEEIPADSTSGTLISELEDALLKQQLSHMSSSALRETQESRFNSLIQHRLTELEELPVTMGEDLQMKCLLELYGLKLVELQRKVRSDVCAEYWLNEKCAHPDKQLFDWGMMRLRYPFSMYGIGDSFRIEADDRHRKKRYTERMSRLEEDEKNQADIRKRKFFAEILNSAREFQLQAQAILKRRKQRNDGIQAWHARQRQRATRAEKLRFQALKADDQEAYMKMVEESKNERLTMLLSKTNELLVCLGAAVQRQKDADGNEAAKDSESEKNSVSNCETPGELSLDDDNDFIDADSGQFEKANDLLEGQRQYNSAVHSIQEKVTEQPTLLQGGELRPYQIEGLQWMLSLFNNNLNGILADEMGLGKTIQTIALIAYLMENKGVTGPHLIIAPKAVLPNWINEFSAWVPSVTAVLYDGRLDERKAMREEYSGEGKFNVMITHYDLIMRDKAFLKKIHWYYMIVDEGHRLKNHECALARTLVSGFMVKLDDTHYDLIMRDKAFLKKIHWYYMIVDEGHRLKNHECALARTLVSGYRIRRRLLLTGTPIQNSLQELWALLNFLLPSIFNSVQNFEEWFNAPFMDKCELSLTDEEELLIIRRLHQVIRPFLLRRKKNEVEKYLPGKTQVILKCDLSAWQKAYYLQVTDLGRVGLESGIKSKSLQNLSMQLRKCCNHPYLFVGDYNMWQKEQIVRASGKFELLDRLLPKLQRAGHRVLLFSQMTRLIDILEIYLQLYDFKYLRLDGSTKTEERGKFLKQFNAPDSPYFMFLLSTRAGGLGLNLQTADTVIIFDSDWNPQMDQQAEDRAHRIGQKKEVRVFVLISVGSIEEEILERAKQKMGIDAKVIQAGLFNTTSTAQDRRQMLQEIMQRGTSSLGTDVPSEREINRLAARTEEEFWLFERMDEERRRKERYRSRLMEENEVPDWVFHNTNNDKAKLQLGQGTQGSSEIIGKRSRKEVVYVDLLSDVQWMKAVEAGEDASKISSRRKRKEHPSDACESVSNNVDQESLSEQKNIGRSIFDDDISNDSPIVCKSDLFHNKDEGESDASSFPDNFTWRTHKRKRSSHGICSGPKI